MKAKSLFEGYKDMSAVNTILLSGEMDLHPESWLNAERGKDKLTLSVGQKCEAVGNGILKAGTRVTIEIAETVNGYSRYYAGGCWHKENELRPITQEDLKFDIARSWKAQKNHNRE